MQLKSICQVPQDWGSRSCIFPYFFCIIRRYLSTMVYIWGYIWLDFPTVYVVLHSQLESNIVVSTLHVHLHDVLAVTGRRKIYFRHRMSRFFLLLKRRVENIHNGVKSETLERRLNPALCVLQTYFRISLQPIFNLYLFL